MIGGEEIETVPRVNYLEIIEVANGWVIQDKYQRIPPVIVERKNDRDSMALLLQRVAAFLGDPQALETHRAIIQANRPPLDPDVPQGVPT